MKKGFAQINSEIDACEFASRWREYDDNALEAACLRIVKSSCIRAVQIMLAKGFHVNSLYPSTAYGYTYYNSLMLMSRNTLNQSSVEMRRLIYNQPGADITELLSHHISHSQSIRLDIEDAHFDQTTSLLLEAGAKWPYDIRPLGCQLLHNINVAKRRATMLLHGLKGVIPKDLISQIVTEIYDNRMNKK